MAPLKRIGFMVFLAVIIAGTSGCSKGDGTSPAGKVIFPRNGVALLRGTEDTIKWEDQKSPTVRIKLLRGDEVFLNIAANAENTGNYLWTVGEDVPYDSIYNIRIYSNSDDFLYYSGEGTFTIISPGDTSSFTDPRDGTVYRTVNLGGLWWFAENFRYESGPDAVCYENDPSNCLDYGKLYSYDDAKALAPEGWHLPTDSDWRRLEAYAGIHQKERFLSGYRGVNAGTLLAEGGGTGFDAKYGGYMYRGFLAFSGIGKQGWYWSSTYVSSSRTVYIRTISTSAGGISRTSLKPAAYHMSVRYVKDVVLPVVLPFGK